MIIIESGLNYGTLDTNGLGNNPLIAYQNLIASVAANDDGSNVVNNALNVSTAEKWVADPSDTTQVIFDFQVSGYIDYVAIANHNFHLMDGTITLQHSSDGISYFDSFSAQTITGRQPIIFYFSQKTDGYYRLVLNATTTFTVTPFFSNIQAGNILVIPRNIYVGHTPINYGINTRTIGGKSETGEFLGRKEHSQSLQSQINLEFIDQYWYRNTFYQFQRHAITKPFFFIWRPASYQNETAFCWTTRDMDVTNNHANGQVDISFRIEGHNSVWL